MKHHTMLIIASLLSVVLGSLHLADDIARGISPAGIDNMIAVLIFVVLLLGATVLAERPSGLVVMLLGGLIALAMPLLHLRGSKIGAIASSNGGFFFIWTLLALGTLGIFAIILSAHGLWKLRSREPR